MNLRPSRTCLFSLFCRKCTRTKFQSQFCSIPIALIALIITKSLAKVSRHDVIPDPSRSQRSMAWIDRLPAQLHQLGMARRRGPPIGAHYEQSLRLPLLGNQTIHLEVVSRKKARLRLHGALTLDDAIRFEMMSSGEFAFTLSSPTLRLLRRFRASLTEADYLSEDDEAVIVVAALMLPPVRVRLKRCPT
mmetsp:Transcript_18855/g.31542  ORF Transcript_18855/g.31542 Transcript_18855/m.31542 type:complete len:190 (-) Transcript_18855:258-827(-)